MNLDQITTKCWILALFIRDDGERLLLGDGWFDFKDSLQHFQPNSIANDIVELQGTDGQLLAGQVRRSASQSFDGYVGDALTSKTEIENRRRQFIQFFRTRRHYKVIYIFPDGTAIQRRMGYLTDAPSVPEMWQKFPEYHVALNFEDVNYYEYAEDAQGDEIYAHESLVKLISVQSGGLVWDEYGAVSHGYTWLNPQTVTGDYITVTNGATGSPLTLSQLAGNAEQTTYSGKNLLPPASDFTSTKAGITFKGVDGIYTLTGTATASVLSDRYVVAGYTIQSGDFLHLGNSSVQYSVAFVLNFTDSTKADPILNVVNRIFDLSEHVGKTISSIQFFVANGVNVGTLTFSPMIVKSSTATAYEPYVGGTASPNPDYSQAIETVTGGQTVAITGKNLVDISTVEWGYVNSSGTITGRASQQNWLSEPIKVSPSTTYTFSLKNPSGSDVFTRLSIAYYDSSEQFISRDAQQTGSSTSRSFTTPNNCEWVRVTSAKSPDWTEDTRVSYQPQFELGSTATAYEPYQGQEFPIDLDTIELAKIGTYQDYIWNDGGTWKVHKEIGKVVYNGSESWGPQGGTGYTRVYVRGLSDALIAPVGVIGIMADNYTGILASELRDEQKDYGIALSNSANRIFIRDKDQASASDLQTWLSTHNTTVYYALATPTTTEITDETLLAQLNFVASLYEGVNNISIVGTGAQGEMTLNYYADVDTTGAGYEWEAGEEGGPTIVQVIGVDNAQPIWTVTGPATNPTLTNITTVQTITWNGTVPNSQKLIVDMANQTATLAGANVYEFITGSWLTLRPGANKLTYSAQGADQASQIQWNGVVG